SSRRRHTRLQGDWSSDVCSSDLRTNSRYNRGKEIGKECTSREHGLWRLQCLVQAKRQAETRTRAGKQASTRDGGHVRQRAHLQQDVDCPAEHGDEDENIAWSKIDGGQCFQ